VTRGPHDHDHDHGAHTGWARAHAPVDFNRAFATAVALNATLILAQVICGIIANSVALLADAGHNFADVLGLLLAWGAHGVARWQPTRRFTYGWRSASILAGLLNGLILLIATGAIAWEAIQRLVQPGPVASTTVMLVAAIAVTVNGASAWMLAAGRKADLNVRAAVVHLVGDATISLGVVGTGAVIYLTEWFWVDAAASLVIVGLIVWGSWGVLRQSFELSLAAIPQAIDRSQVEHYLRTLPEVTEVHDLHIWAISTTETALTAHLVRPGASLDDAFLRAAEDELARRFAIRHCTLQVEAGDYACRLAADHVV
jgi:cobalt-zinc-cadmium efflux system protein